jgi:tetratricopeptide (TPR) repeat protein
VEPSDVVIHHVGYQNPALLSAKAQRNLRLLLKEVADNPNDPFVLFNLGVSYQLLGQLPEALTAYKRGIEQEGTTGEFMSKMFVLYAQGLFQLDRPEQALSVCQAGRNRFQDSVELPFTESIIRGHLHDDAGAEKCLIDVLQIDPARAVSGEDEEIRRYKARHNLALLFFKHGRHAEAEHQWRQVLQDCPDCQQSRAALTRLLETQGRQREIDSLRQSQPTLGSTGSTA